MKTIQGPAIFLAQFMGDAAPFDTLDHLAEWAGGLGYKGIQIPADARLIDLATAAESEDYCDDLLGRLAAFGVEPTELSTHLQGQLVAVHPAYDTFFDGFAAAHVRGNPVARQAWAVEQVKLAARASANLGLSAHATFSGALAWPYVYPWPQRPAGLIDEAFAELARRWHPILDVLEDVGVDCAFEIHPGEDLHDGVTFERFLTRWRDIRARRSSTIRRIMSCSSLIILRSRYLSRADQMLPRKGCGVQFDRPFRRLWRVSVLIDCPGRFRSLGDGQVDSGAIFAKMAHYDLPGWAVLEWECALKHPEDGAAEGAPFIEHHIIRVTPHALTTLQPQVAMPRQIDN